MQIPGPCFRDALKDANVTILPNLSIPDWIPIEEIPVICGRLGLEWFGAGYVEIDIEPVIVLYRTREDIGHAVFVSDVGPLLGCVEIVGLIRVSPHD